jgi:hypothetical protein
VQVEGLVPTFGGAKGKSKDGTMAISETRGNIEKHGKINNNKKRKII